MEFAKNYPFFVFFLLTVCTSLVAWVFGEGFLNVVRARLMYVFIGPGLLSYTYALYGSPILKEEINLAVLIWAGGVFLLCLWGAIGVARVRTMKR